MKKAGQNIYPSGLLFESILFFDRFCTEFHIISK